MSTWNTTSTNSRFGSTGVGPAIEGSFSTAWRIKQSPSIPSRTSPWSNVPREQGLRPQQVVATTANLSEVNNHPPQLPPALIEDGGRNALASQLAETMLGLGAF